MEEKKLFLLDAYALIYRAYYALIRAPRITSDGRNTSAIFGFCNALDDILRKENPPYMAVCFDPRGKTFRHEEYPEYKAQRDKQPEDITFAIPYIKDIIEATGIRCVEVPRYEADDVIGTLAVEAQRGGFDTYMMTLDKDYGQLVTDHIFMYRPATKGNGFEIRGPQQVCERYGITDPRQVIDLLALEGDASDNIPGCPGVGEKTAVRLINQFGSVDNMLANTDQIKGALRAKIEDNAANIRFSRHLVTICTDVPLDVTPDDLLRREPDIERLAAIYRDLEFRSFLARMGADTAPAPAAAPPADSMPMGSLFDTGDDTTPATPAEVQHLAAYTIVTDPATLARRCEQAGSGDCLALAINADGDEAMTAVLRGIAVCHAPGQAFYVPLDAGLTDQYATILQPMLANPACTVVSHDIKRDTIILRRHGIDITAPYYDTSVAHYILKPEMKHDLPDVALTLLGLRMREYDLSATERRRPLTGTPDQVAATVCARAEAVLALRPMLHDALVADGTEPLMRDIELPLIRVLADMEWTGVRIDVRELDDMSRHMTARVRQLEDECYALAGHEFKISSPAQVGEVLFGQMQIDPKARRTKTGAYSTTEEILEKYRSRHPIVDLILRIRGMRKLLTTYIDALPRLVNPRTHRIHTTYNQTVTATGRISSTNPNLQNIPIRTDDGREIRRAFIADDGCLLMSADYSQIELRLMACLSQDPTMIEAFNSGADIHRATAARIYHIPLDQVTDTQRRNAKTANFGIIYGISPFGLSERLGIPRAEAKDLIDGYLRTYPGVRRYMDDSIDRARTHLYVATIHGRKRYLPDINSRNAVVRGYAERNAINAPLQGSAADIIKIAMIAIDRRFRHAALRSRMLMQVHDELVFNVHPDELDTVRDIVVSSMEAAFRGDVPLTVGVGTGHNWLEAH